MPALYASNSIALAALEKFVHVGPAPQLELVLVAIDVPNECALAKPQASDLPAGWATLPVSPAARQFGAAWLSSASELGLWVPSALIPEEFNLLINPRHSHFARVALSVIRPFSFDTRLFK